MELSLPSFNLLVNKQLFIDFSDIISGSAAIGFVLVTGFLAGSYPAFYLSSFKPIKVLKGVLKTSREGMRSPRKFLVVLQFSFAIILIISTIVVLQQIRYAQDTGFRISKRSDSCTVYMQGDLQKNYDADPE